jgi:putative ABC transport system permease protein
MAVNDSPVDLSSLSERGQRFADREQNLSWSKDLPADNQIISGVWWTEGVTPTPSVSVASEFQESLKLQLGDRLTFDIAGEKLVAKLTSVRKVRWDGFKPNFFLVFSPGALDFTTGTFMTSIYLDSHQRLMLAELVRQFPSVTVFDVEQLMQQVKETVDRASEAIQLVFVFALLAGMLVLLAAVQTTRQERRFESALLRALGGSRRLVLAGVVVEFMVIGTLSGVLAACAASLAGWGLSVYLFNLPYRFDAMLWLGGVGVGTLLVGVTGTLATWSVLRAPPVLTLREG